MSSTLTYLVTGSSRGIGLEFVKQILKNEKNNVVATCRNPSTANALKELKHKEGQLEIIPMDVNDADSIKNVKIQLEKKGVQSIDCLINNAGIATPNHPMETFIATTKEDFNSLMNTNVFGPIQTTQIFHPLLKRSDNTFSKVICISSLLGSISENSTGGKILYRTSKAALNQVIKTASYELLEDNIAIYSFHPGWVQTDMGGKGGRKAPLSTEESVNSLLKVIYSLKKEQTGEFFNYDGKKLDW